MVRRLLRKLLRRPEPQAERPSPTLWGTHVLAADGRCTGIHGPQILACSRADAEFVTSLLRDGEVRFHIAGVVVGYARKREEAAASVLVEMDTDGKLH